MAKCAQDFVFVFVSAMLSSYLLCQQVSGIALKQPEGTYETNTSGKPISLDGNKFLTESGEVIELFPLSEPHLELQFNSTRRRLGSFMSCSACTCCDSSHTTCYSLPCCFAINCSSQPYGFCQFLPVSCYCQGCGE